MNKIYIDDVGSGFPLVLVHGYLGSSKMWCNQINYFSKFCRVISPALPGFGESNSVQSLDSINEMAQLIIKTLDEKTFLYGKEDYRNPSLLMKRSENLND